MSTMESVIGEHDVVALLKDVGRWPTGTRGTVVDDHPTHKMVEMPGIEFSGDEEMFDYMPSVPTEDLRLVWKCPAPDSKAAVD